MKIRGISEGGVRTSFILPRFKLAFDAGHGDPGLTDLPRILLTHGHLDHSSGLPYYISQRALRRLPPPEIYCPPQFAERFKKIMELWGEIEDYQSQFRIIETEYEREYPLSGNVYFRAIPAIHRVPGNGYVLAERTTKLKSEFASLRGPEIARLKQERDDLFYEIEKPLFAFSGDTQIEFVLENEIVRRARVLMLDCTYVSEDRPRARARKWGHTHLDEIAENAEAFREIRKLYLIHISPRYSSADVEKEIKKRLPSWLLKKTEACMKGRR